jgi:UDP:flavonoid glycosyltransferase YjiC (YdhE family)
MGRFLFATMGSLGDLHPYIAIARALVERGHRGVIASAAEYRVPVQNAGVEFARVRPDHADFVDYRAAVARIFDSRRGAERLIREMVMPSLRLAYDDLLEASQGTNLLVSHPLTFTLQLVAERRHLPWVATALAPLSFMSSFDPPVIAPVPWLRKLRWFGPKPYALLFGLLKRIASNWEAPLRQFRKDLGLPPLMKPALFEGQFSPRLNLALFDSQLARPQPDWPEHTVVCGSPVFEGTTQNDSQVTDLNRFLAAGEAPIVFGLGSSAVWVAGSFWEHAMAAARELGRRAILITGPTSPKLLSEGIKAFSYLPYSKVFPAASVVVHQGGTGTLAQALRAGRPQLILPLAFDQPDNANRATALGLARAIPFWKAKSQRLVTELKQLLWNSDYAAKAHAVAQELTKVNGAEFAAAELIACLERHSAPH